MFDIIINMANKCLIEHKASSKDTFSCRRSQWPGWSRNWTGPEKSWSLIHELNPEQNRQGRVLFLLPLNRAGFKLFGPVQNVIVFFRKWKLFQLSNWNQNLFFLKKTTTVWNQLPSMVWLGRKYHLLHELQINILLK